MEADWEIEIGGDATTIDAAWPGLVNLRAESNRVHEIAETAHLPGLAETLLQLNGSPSPVWTAKCDVWEQADFDPDEMESGPAEARQALACYIDLLPRMGEQWASPQEVVDSCKAWIARLQPVALANCRVDFVIRRAWIKPGIPNLGVTAYVTACGEELNLAARVLGAALAAMANAVTADCEPLQPFPK